MREIKFRAWDRKNKKMFPNVSTGTLVVFGDNHEKADSDECVFLQFTGLKDKNGVEIYEGDLIRMDGWSPENYEIGFREGGFCFYNPGAMSTDISMIEDSRGNHSQVIGNIYQNPELLA